VSRWRLFYHVVWGTKHREPVINEAAADLIRRAIQRTCTDNGVIVHAIGVMPEHVHLAVSIPPRIAIANFVRDVKGSCSHLINRSIQQPVGD
jgi:putative transposase